MYSLEPSKTDVDVLRVLEHVDLDYDKLPNICVWKDNMAQFNEDHLSRLVSSFIRLVIYLEAF